MTTSIHHCSTQSGQLLFRMYTLEIFKIGIGKEWKLRYRESTCGHSAGGREWYKWRKYQQLTQHCGAIFPHFKNKYEKMGIS